MPASVQTGMRDEQRRARRQKGILEIIKGIGPGIGRGLGKAGFVGGHFTQVRIAYGNGGLRARGKGPQMGVAAYLIPFRLGPTDVVAFEAARPTENGRHIAFAHGSFAHVPGAEKNPVEARVLCGLFLGVEQGFVRAGGLGVDVQILRKLAQIRQRAHPGGQISLAGGYLFAAAGRKQHQAEHGQEEAEDSFHGRCFLLWREKQ